MLEKSGIVFKSSGEALKFLNSKDFDNISLWWNSNDTQQARKKFTENFVRKKSESIDILLKQLNSHI